MVSEPGHRFESLESHCEGRIVRDFIIRSNTNGLGLQSNTIKDVCPFIFTNWLLDGSVKPQFNCKMLKIGVYC